MQEAGAEIVGAAGKALEAEALGAPPFRLDGFAGAVIAVVEHVRVGTRIRGSVLLVRTGVGRRGA